MPIEELIGLVASLVVLSLAAFGLSFWAFRARSDRSALVGLYLLFGIPATLLGLWGLARVATSGGGNGALFLVVGLALGLPLLPPVRRLVAAVTPMDATSPVDMTGLCLMLATPAILALLVASTPAEAEETASPADIEIVLQTVVLVAFAYAAVGWWFVRPLREATARLGLVRPSWKTAAAAVGFLGVVFVVYLVLAAIGLVVQPEAFEELSAATEQLTREVRDPAGALLLGVSAGVGEEVFFRGALQPRFGIVLPSLVFALLHGFQYGFNFPLVILFGVSVVFGVERRLFGTTAAVATHALYDIVAVLLLTYG